MVDRSGNREIEKNKVKLNHFTDNLNILFHGIKG
jgi:hypothetical protein